MPETQELQIPLDRPDAVHCPNCRRRVHTGTWPLLSVVPCPYCAKPVSIPGRIGPFTVHHIAARGPVVWIFDAVDPAKNLPVVLQVARPDPQDKPLLETFVKQTKLLARSRHPNLVRILSLGQSKGLLYTVFQSVPGQRLSALVDAARGWSEPQILQLAIDVVQALGEAAARGVVHGDVQPQNILLNHDGHALVLNFGLDLLATRLTEGGKLWASPLYVSPETATGHPAGAVSDIYSLGAIVYHLFAGRPPFQLATPRETVAARLKAEPAPLQQFRDVSPFTAQIVHRMLATQPRDRYGDYDSLLSDLCAAAGIEAAAPELVPADASASGSVAFFDADAVEAAADAAEEDQPEFAQPDPAEPAPEDAAAPRRAPLPRRRRRSSIPVIFLALLLLAAIVGVVVLILKSPALNPPPGAVLGGNKTAAPAKHTTPKTASPANPAPRRSEPPPKP